MSTTGRINLHKQIDKSDLNPDYYQKYSTFTLLQVRIEDIKNTKEHLKTGRERGIEREGERERARGTYRERNRE